jgi:hypothetical protein
MEFEVTRWRFAAARLLFIASLLKTREKLWQQSLSATLELVQKWGTISTSLEGAAYLHGFDKNHLEVGGELSLRLFQGFNFNIHGSCGGRRRSDHPQEACAFVESK